MMAVATTLQVTPRAVLKGQVSLAPHCCHPPNSEQMRDVPEAVPLVSEALRHRQDCRILATPVDHLPGTVGRFVGKLEHLSLHQGRILPRVVFHSSFSENELHSRLQKVWEMSLPLPTAAHSPVGTRAGGNWEPLCWSGWGNTQGATPFIHPFTQQGISWPHTWCCQCVGLSAVHCAGTLLSELPGSGP